MCQRLIRKFYKTTVVVLAASRSELHIEKHAVPVDLPIRPHTRHSYLVDILARVSINTFVNTQLRISRVRACRMYVYTANIYVHVHSEIQRTCTDKDIYLT